MTTMTSIRNDSRKQGTLSVLAMFSAAALLALSACGGGSDKSGDDSAGKSDNAKSQTLAADEWVSNFDDFKEAADWDTAKVVTLDLGTDSLKPASLALVAGQPYEIEISNSGEADQGISAPDLFRGSAVRKTESGAEIKLTLFDGVYVAAAKKVSLFIIPVIPGSYEMVGMADDKPVAGMTGTVKVSGDVPTKPAPKMENISTAGVPAGAEDLITKARPTWDKGATAVTITMGDNGDAHFYNPKNTVLKAGVPATITFVNKGNVLHVYEAADFLKTAALWKVTGANGWCTGGLARPADVEAGVETSLYVIPTKAGSYPLTDSTPGMESMKATITVE
ncbi:MAG: cupredoxin domain-containing protein [Aeromicrobium sp.]